MMYHRLGRTPEFLIYGPGQQRRAVIEALRIMENDQNSAQETTVQKFEDLPIPSTDIVKSLKENSKKWLKFVTQVHF